MYFYTKLPNITLETGQQSPRKSRPSVHCSHYFNTFLLALPAPEIEPDLMRSIFHTPNSPQRM